MSQRKIRYKGKDFEWRMVKYKIVIFCVSESILIVDFFGIFEVFM